MNGGERGIIEGDDEEPYIARQDLRQGDSIGFEYLLQEKKKFGEFSAQGGATMVRAAPLLWLHVCPHWVACQAHAPSTWPFVDGNVLAECVFKKSKHRHFREYRQRL